MEVWGTKIYNFTRGEHVLQAQEWYGPPVSSCQVWYGSDIACRQGAKCSTLFIWAALRTAYSAGISVTQTESEVFRPAGVTRCTDWG